MPRDAVLDASALLAMLHGEPGTERVAACIPGALLSAVNLAEVVGQLAEAGMPTNDIRSALAGLGLRVVALDEALAYEVGLLRPETRRGRADPVVTPLRRRPRSPRARWRS